MILDPLTIYDSSLFALIFPWFIVLLPLTFQLIPSETCAHSRVLEKNRRACVRTVAALHRIYASSC